MTRKPTQRIRKSRSPRRFAVCVCDGGYGASLEAWKIYPMLDDAQARRHGLVRVMDESGEDYLFPHTWFRPLELPAELRRLYPA